MADDQGNMATDMADKAITIDTIEENEYETQFLHFAPKSFCSGLYNAVLEYTWEYFYLTQDYMKSQFSKTISKEELQRGSEVFLSTVSKAIDRAFDKFEVYLLSSIMCIPDEVVLPEDQVQEDYKHYSKEDIKQLDQDIDRLKDQIRAAKYLNMSLRKERKQVDQVLKEYSQFLDVLRSMDKTMKEAGVSDARESLVFNIEKSNRVIDILREIECTDASKRPLPDATDLNRLAKKVKHDECPP